jgi:hypothetical protein
MFKQKHFEHECGITPNSSRQDGYSFLLLTFKVAQLTGFESHKMHNAQAAIFERSYQARALQRSTTFSGTSLRIKNPLGEDSTSIKQQLYFLCVAGQCHIVDGIVA